MSPARIATVTHRRKLTSQRDFELDDRALQLGPHSSRIGSSGSQSARQEVLESSQFSKDGRPDVQDLVGCAGGHDPSLVHHDDTLAKAYTLSVRMGDIEDRNPPSLVPPPQVFDDQRLNPVIERGERLVEQERQRFGDERSRQRRPLALAA